MWEKINCISCNPKPSESTLRSPCSVDTVYGMRAIGWFTETMFASLIEVEEDSALLGCTYCIQQPPPNTWSGIITSAMSVLIQRHTEQRRSPFGRLKYSNNLLVPSWDRHANYLNLHKCPLEGFSEKQFKRQFWTIQVWVRQQRGGT